MRTRRKRSRRISRRRNLPRRRRRYGRKRLTLRYIHKRFLKHLAAIRRRFAKR